MAAKDASADGSIDRVEMMDPCCLAETKCFRVMVVVVASDVDMTIGSLKVWLFKLMLSRWVMVMASPITVIRRSERPSFFHLALLFCMSSSIWPIRVH